MKKSVFFTLAFCLAMPLIALAGPDLDLWRASMSGNLEGAKSAIAAGADVNAKNPDGDTPLQLAAIHREVAELLIGTGAEINVKNRWGYTPLMMAIGNNKPDAAAMFIDRGADVFVEGQGGETALFLAVLNKDPDLVGRLLKKGEKMSRKTGPTGFTVVHYVARGCQDVGILEFALSKGGSVEWTDNRGQTPLFYAFMMGYPQIVNTLVDRGADVNAEDNAGYLVTYYAANAALNEGTMEALDVLISRGADINRLNRGGYSMMSACAQHGFIPVMEILLEKGADIRVRNTAYGGTLLHDAALGGHIESVRFIIGKGLGPNERATDGATPLITASKKGNTDAARALLDAGADINAVDKFSRTALHYASEKGGWELIDLLIARGADKTIKDTWGKTYDQITGDESSATVIVTPGGKKETGAADPEGNTPLHSASAKGITKEVKLLVSRGADLNARNNAGNTPLHAAAEKGKISTVRLLLDSGARADIRNAKGLTPAALAKKKGYRSAYRMLDAAEKKLRKAR